MNDISIKVTRSGFNQIPVVKYNIQKLDESDLSILRQAGFNIVVDNSNPAVKDRGNAVNAVILNGEGKRWWLVNTNLCPV